MQGYGTFCVLYVSVLCYSVTGQVTVLKGNTETADPVLRRMHEELKEVDSDFDFEAAILNFKQEDYENVTQELAAKLADLGPKNKIHLVTKCIFCTSKHIYKTSASWLLEIYDGFQKPKQTPNITATLCKAADKKDQNEDITKLLKAGEALLDTPNERLFKNYRRAIMEKEMAEPENSTNSSEEYLITKKRVKRQGGKFQEAAKVDNMKMLRIYLTMFKNLWARSYVGGKHPLHKDVPKAACIQFKRRIMETFFPPIGSDRRGYS